MPDGADKSQILKDVDRPIMFFGDKTEPGGNDYPLAEALNYIKECKTVQVNNWEETKNELEKL